MAISQRQRELLVECTTPRTIKELAEKYEVHPQTIRRELWLLKELGVIREVAFRAKGEKKWQTLYLDGKEDHRELGAYNLNQNNRSFSAYNALKEGMLDVLEGAASRAIAVGKYALADLFAEYALHSHFNVPFVEGYPTVKGTRGVLQGAIAYLEDLRDFLKQIEALPAWEDVNLSYVLFGQESLKENTEFWDLIRQLNNEFSKKIDESPNWQRLIAEAEGRTTK